MMRVVLFKLVEALIGIVGRMIIQGLAKLAEADLQKKVTKIAIPYVENLMTVKIEDTEKQKQAFAQIKAECKRLGIAAGDWLINTTIEAVVGDIKAR